MTLCHFCKRPASRAIGSFAFCANHVPFPADLTRPNPQPRAPRFNVEKPPVGVVVLYTLGHGPSVWQARPALVIGHPNIEGREELAAPVRLRVFALEELDGLGRHEVEAAHAPDVLPYHWTPLEAPTLRPVLPRAEQRRALAHHVATMASETNAELAELLAAVMPSAPPRVLSPRVFARLDARTLSERRTDAEMAVALARGATIPASLVTSCSSVASDLMGSALLRHGLLAADAHAPPTQPAKDINGAAVAHVYAPSQAELDASNRALAAMARGYGSTSISPPAVEDLAMASPEVFAAFTLRIRVDD